MRDALFSALVACLTVATLAIGLALVADVAEDAQRAADRSGP